MIYSVYLDSLLAELFLWNLSIFMITNLKFSKAIKNFRLVLGGACMAVWYLAAMLSPFPVLVKSMAGVLGMLIGLAWTFRAGSLSGYINILRAYLGCTLLIGGLLYVLTRFLKSRQRAMTIILMAVPVIMGGLKVLGKNRRSRCKEEGRAVLVLPSGKVKMNCLLDTGNCLVEPISGKAVCVISSTVAQGIWQEDAPCRVIPYQCIGQKKGIMRGYPVPEIRLEMGGPGFVCKDVYVAVSPRELTKEGKRIDLLISPGLLED